MHIEKLKKTWLSFELCALYLVLHINPCFLGFFFSLLTFVKLRASRNPKRHEFSLFVLRIVVYYSLHTCFHIKQIQTDCEKLQQSKQHVCFSLSFRLAGKWIQRWHVWSHKSHYLRVTLTEIYSILALNFKISGTL